jgi:hypothetical protein
MQTRGKGNIGIIFETLAPGFRWFVYAAARRTAFVRPVSLSSASIGFHLRLSLFFVSIRVNSRLRFAVSFTDTKLAEDPPEEIFGIMSPDDITDSV